MKTAYVLLFVVVIVVLFVGGQAQALPFTAELLGINERPLPVVTPATGFVTVLLNDTEDMLRINLTFSGLLAPQTAAHIHALGGPDDVAPVRIAPPSLPLGQLVDFDIFIPDPLPGDPLLSRADFVQGLKDGQTYFNVHSTVNPGGEIRGQLEIVPEPTTLLLWGTTLTGLGLARWRQRRRGKQQP